MGYSRPRYYTLCHQTTSVINPLDATAYYVGGAGITVSTVANQRQTIIPKTGVIREAMIMVYSTSATGTAEDWTWSLYDGTTTTAIQTVGAATTIRTFRNSNMNFPVIAGGYVQATTTTPTWVANPEGIMTYMVLLIETS